MRGAISSQSKIRQQVAAWRQSEDHLYRTVLQEPSLYTTCIRLVRALADRLGEIRDTEALLQSYQEVSLDFVESVAESLELQRREFIDYELATDTAFYLRYQKIVEESSLAAARERIDRARSEGAQWVVLYDEETRSRGHSYFQRLEMHLPDGLGLRTSSELDWEKGRVYLVEPMMFDPDTGQPAQGVRPPGPLQEFATREEMASAADALRREYSSGRG